MARQGGRVRFSPPRTALRNQLEVFEAALDAHERELKKSGKR